jgi:hypothetical protein
MAHGRYQPPGVVQVSDDLAQRPASRKIFHRLVAAGEVDSVVAAGPLPDLLESQRLGGLSADRVEVAPQLPRPALVAAVHLRRQAGPINRRAHPPRSGDIHIDTRARNMRCGTTNSSAQ